MPLISMTGFADLRSGGEGIGWVWEARSVNGRGLDLRLRLPDGLEMLEVPIRAAVARDISRGSVTIGLRIGNGAQATLPRLNKEVLDSALEALLAANAAAAARGIDLAPVSAVHLLSLRGVLEAESKLPSENPEIVALLTSEASAVVAALADARRAEGVAIATIVAGQISRIAKLCESARRSADARGCRQGEVLRARLDAVLSVTAAPVDPARLAQELALLAVKADVTEEIDRLAAHVASAEALLVADGAVGRKFDFLTQEFSREANTLCAKSGAPDLTSIGLELKVVIDQLREQVQNVE